MEKFSHKDHLGMNFYDCDERDFFLGSIGYNDFHYIQPQKSPRVQKFYTLHLILSGRGTLNIYGKTYTLKPFDMFFVPPNQRMCYYPDEAEPWTYVWFEFTGVNAKLYEKKLGFEDRNPVVYCSNQYAAYTAVYDVFSKLDIDGKVGYYEALSMFYRLLDTQIGSDPASEQTLAKKINAYILCHYHNPDLIVEDVCRDFGISHSHLCKIFQKQQGYTVKQALINTRIDAAKRLLAESRLSVGDVAYSVGFSDPIHFMKTFKRCTGMTAGAYRNTFERRKQTEIKS